MNRDVEIQVKNPLFFFNENSLVKLTLLILKLYKRK